MRTQTIRLEELAHYGPPSAGAIFSHNFTAYSRSGV
jgi:hypothetical protein